MSTRVLVVGGAGYIGGSVVDCFLKKKIPFSVYDNLTYENHYLKPIEFIYGDVRDRVKLKKLLHNYSHIIWLAAIVGDDACSINPRLTKEINQHSVQWLSRNYNGRIIFASTCSVYGASDLPVSELSLLNPLSLYAQTKKNAENYLLRHRNALIFRLGTAYGISDTYSRIRMDLAINYMTMNAVLHKKLHVFYGKQWRPFMHVKDIGNVIAESVNKKHKGIYNLASQNLTILQVGKAIKHHTGCRMVVTGRKFQDSRNYNADTSKAVREEIYIPSKMRDIVCGISEIKELVLSNRVKDLQHEFYSNYKCLLRTIDKYENGFKNSLSY